jgi:Ca2+-binding RTX toxin-like protein
MAYLNYLGQPMPESAAPTNQVTGSNADNQTLTAPPGPSAVDPGTGAGNLMIGSSGDNIFYIKNPTDRVQVAGGLPGIKSVVAYTSFTLPDNVQNLDLTGSYNFAVGNSLDNLIVGHSDHETLYGGPGNDVLVGAGNGTSFIVPVGQGNDVVYGLTPADNVRLIGSSFKSFADVQGAMRQQGSDVVLQIDPNETLTFRNMSTSQLHESNFLLPLDRSKLGPMTFDDEFNSLQLWNSSTGTGQWLPNYGGDPTQRADFSLPQNGELQVYTSPSFTGTGTQPLGYNPFSVSNGVLTITAQTIPQQDQAAAFGANYSSGLLDTRYIFEQKYGYFEIRMALPTAQGSWPAFWMTDFNGLETDIGENTSTEPQIDHVRAYGSGQVEAWDEALKTGDPSGFHNYGLLWTPQTLTWYYDDVAVFQAPTPADWTRPMFMLLNLAVGSYGGQPDPSQYPAQMQVDYVRAYALPDGSSVVQHGIPPVFGTGGDDNMTAPGGGGQVLYGVAGNDTMTAQDGSNTLFGGDGNDLITGGSGFTQVNGNKGDDTVIGRSATGDWHLGGQGNDSINSTQSHGRNILNGNLGNDTIAGGPGDDSLRGGQGDDLLRGGQGNDWLSGDLGHDTLTGGGGADIFHAMVGGVSVVTDFNYSEGDRVQLDPGVQYSAAQSGPDVVVSLTGGGSITLQNAQLSSFGSGWLVA